MDIEGLILDVTSADGDFDRTFLERLGHPVLVCHGPEIGHLCPILKDGCEMVSSTPGDSEAVPGGSRRRHSYRGRGWERAETAIRQPVGGGSCVGVGTERE